MSSTDARRSHRYCDCHIVLGKGSCGLIQVAAGRRRTGMRMGRIGGFEACTFVGVDEVVGNRIGPWREFFFKGGRGCLFVGVYEFWLDSFLFGVLFRLRYKC